jgi:hypothetical protein
LGLCLYFYLSPKSRYVNNSDKWSAYFFFLHPFPTNDEIYNQKYFFDSEFVYPRNDLNVHDIASTKLKFVLSTNSSTRI